MSSISSRNVVTQGIREDKGGLDFITENLSEVRMKIESAIAKRTPELKVSFPKSVRLVAVSKTKPSSLLVKAYQSGQRHFGENYIQELMTKAQELENECPEIHWHYIGHLQSNKVGKLLSIGKYLSVVETIDSERLAGTVNTQRRKWIESDPSNRKEIGPLKVMVQVNTSGEEAKGGISPKDVGELVRFIVGECSYLRFLGLMTIGKEYENLNQPNPDFLVMCELRESLCQALNLDRQLFELSMGMSADFEEAISLGSTNVRVGSTIFGSRK